MMRSRRATSKDMHDKLFVKDIGDRLITVARECLGFFLVILERPTFCFRNSTYDRDGWTLLSLHYISCSPGYCVFAGHVALLLRDEKHFRR